MKTATTRWYLLPLLPTGKHCSRSTVNYFNCPPHRSNKPHRRRKSMSASTVLRARPIEIFRIASALILQFVHTCLQEFNNSTCRSTGTRSSGNQTNQSHHHTSHDTYDFAPSMQYTVDVDTLVSSGVVVRATSYR